MQNKIYRTKDWDNDKESMILPFLYRSARAVRDRSVLVTVASLEWFIDFCAFHFQVQSCCGGTILPLSQAGLCLHCCQDEMKLTGMRSAS